MTLGPRRIRPTPTEIAAILTERRDAPFNYTPQGLTQFDRAPRGFATGRRRVVIGRGYEEFERACRALMHWRQFEVAGCELCWPRTPLIEGAMVALIVRGAFCWWINPCRILYTISQPPPQARFGFAYGTLPGHIAAGEERFLIELDGNDVRYEIVSFSRPIGGWAKLGLPYLRYRQVRFRAASAAVMRMIVSAR